MFRWVRVVVRLVARARWHGGRGRRRRGKSWEQDSAYDGLDLPGEGYDYEEFVEREFGDKPHEQVGIAWYWWLTAVGLLGVFGWWVFGG